MKTIIFLQARLGSTRLPKKAMLKIMGKTVLARIVERLKVIKNVDQVVLVTGQHLINKTLVKEAKRLGIDAFIGSENNVLDRMYQAVKKFKPDLIIRVTGDCPLIDPSLISAALSNFKHDRYDLVSNAVVRSFPDGFDFEIFTKRALIAAWKRERKNYKTLKAWQSAIINPITAMLKNKKLKSKNIINKPNLATWRLTLDYPADLVVVEKLYRALYSLNKYFGFKEIKKFINQHPQLLKINANHICLEYFPANI